MTSLAFTTGMVKYNTTATTATEKIGPNVKIKSTPQFFYLNYFSLVYIILANTSAAHLAIYVKFQIGSLCFRILTTELCGVPYRKRIAAQTGTSPYLA